MINDVLCPNGFAFGQFTRGPASKAFGFEARRVGRVLCVGVGVGRCRIWKDFDVPPFENWHLEVRTKVFKVEDVTKMDYARGES